MPVWFWVILPAAILFIFKAGWWFRIWQERNG
jgi:hypothetical protein